MRRLIRPRHRATAGRGPRDVGAPSHQPDRAADTRVPDRAADPTLAMLDDAVASASDAASEAVSSASEAMNAAAAFFKDLTATPAEDEEGAHLGAPLTSC